MSLFFLHLFLDIMDIIFNIFDKLIYQFVLMHRDALSLGRFSDYGIAWDIEPEYDSAGWGSVAQVPLRDGPHTIVNNVDSVDALDHFFNFLHQSGV